MSVLQVVIKMHYVVLQQILDIQHHRPPISALQELLHDLYYLIMRLTSSHENVMGTEVRMMPIVLHDSTEIIISPLPVTLPL